MGSIGNTKSYNNNNNNKSVLYIYAKMNLLILKKLHNG